MRLLQGTLLDNCFGREKNAPYIVQIKNKRFMEDGQED